MVREGEPAYALYYAGSAEAITLHQAYMVGSLSADQYLVWTHNLKLVHKEVTLDFCQIGLHPWVPLDFQGDVSRDQGIMFGGSGGNYAKAHYFQSYCTESAIEHAITMDKLSGPPVVHYCSQSVKGTNVKALDNSQLDIIVSNTTDLLHELQQHGGETVSKFKYSGCTTAAAEEAPPVDLDKLGNWVEKHEESRKRAKLRYAISGKSGKTLLQPRKISSDIANPDTEANQKRA